MKRNLTNYYKLSLGPDTIKIAISFIILSFAFISLYSEAAQCPPVNTIKRVEGEYRWVTTEPGWEGYFVAPTKGKGKSYKIQRFTSAKWVKTYDSINSPGFIQCDYIGDYGYVDATRNATANPSTNTTAQAYEVIRFVQLGSNGSYLPTNQQSNSKNWTCDQVSSYPSQACFCYTGTDECTFRFG